MTLKQQIVNVCIGHKTSNPLDVITNLSALYCCSVLHFINWHALNNDFKVYPS